MPLPHPEISHRAIERSQRALSLGPAIPRNGHVLLADQEILKDCRVGVSKLEGEFYKVKSKFLEEIREAAVNGHADDLQNLLRKWHISILKFSKSPAIIALAEEQILQPTEILAQYGYCFSSMEKWTVIKDAIHHSHDIVNDENSNDNGPGKNSNNSALEILLEEWRHSSDLSQSEIIEHAANSHSTKALSMILRNWNPVINEPQNDNIDTVTGQFRSLAALVVEWSDPKAIEIGQNLLSHLARKLGNETDDDEKYKIIKEVVKSNQTEALKILATGCMYKFSTDYMQAFIKTIIKPNQLGVLKILVEKWEFSLSRGRQDNIIKTFAEAGQTESLQFLLDRWGRGILNDQKVYIMAAAAEAGQTKSLQFLLDRWGRGIANDQKVDIMEATAEVGQVDTLQMLRERWGHDHDREIMDAAAEKEQDAVLEMLINEGVNPFSHYQAYPTLESSIRNTFQGTFEEQYESCSLVVETGELPIDVQQQLADEDFYYPSLRRCLPILAKPLFLARQEELLEWREKHILGLPPILEAQGQTRSLIIKDLQQEDSLVRPIIELAVDSHNSAIEGGDEYPLSQIGLVLSINLLAEANLLAGMSDIPDVEPLTAEEATKIQTFVNVPFPVPHFTVLAQLQPLAGQREMEERKDVNEEMEPVELPAAPEYQQDYSSKLAKVLDEATEHYQNVGSSEQLLSNVDQFIIPLAGEAPYCGNRGRVFWAPGVEDIYKAVDTVAHTAMTIPRRQEPKTYPLNEDHYMMLGFPPQKPCFHPKAQRSYDDIKEFIAGHLRVNVNEMREHFSGHSRITAKDKAYYELTHSIEDALHFYQDLIEKLDDREQNYFNIMAASNIIDQMENLEQGLAPVSLKSEVYSLMFRQESVVIEPEVDDSTVKIMRLLSKRGIIAGSLHDALVETLTPTPTESCLRQVKAAMADSIKMDLVPRQLSTRFSLLLIRELEPHQDELAAFDERRLASFSKLLATNIVNIFGQFDALPQKCDKESTAAELQASATAQRAGLHQALSDTNVFVSAVELTLDEVREQPDEEPRKTNTAIARDFVSSCIISALNKEDFPISDIKQFSKHGKKLVQNLFENLKEKLSEKEHSIKALKPNLHSFMRHHLTTYVASLFRETESPKEQGKLSLKKYTDEDLQKVVDEAFQFPQQARASALSLRADRAGLAVCA